MTGTGATDAVSPSRALACGAFHPIPWSRNDTDLTILSVREHNAVWQRLCGEGAP
jgi:hypothetical protein